MSEKWTENDIGDQSGRTFLITGANSGIGFEAARALTAHGAHVVLGCRNREKADDAVERISETDSSGSTEILEMDLADLDSVATAATQFRDQHDRLDVLINNAGLMATPQRLTEQGAELQFGVNHLGHFALTGHLLPVLAATGDDESPARVVSISSLGHRPGSVDFDNLQSEDSYNPWRAYFRSKLANLLFTRELDRRSAEAGLDVIAVAAHPGGSDTNLGHEPAGDWLSRLMSLGRPVFGLMTQSAAMGALPTLRAAVDREVERGDYFGPDGFGEMRGHPEKVDMSGKAKDDEVARQLWDVSEEMTGVDYDFDD
jgi:NAD(P)-dependent dehydrogenase (short-subunit alcohol dehydrogenase family)